MTILERNRISIAVRVAFANVLHPGLDKIVEQKPYIDLEADSIRDFLSERNWQSLTNRSLADHYIGDRSAILTFLKPEALQYFLPAFLLISINEFHLADMTALSAIWIFRRVKYDRNYANTYVFSKEQLEASKQVIAYIYENYDDGQEIIDALEGIDILLTNL
jgi:hypothetical protein